MARCRLRYGNMRSTRRFLALWAVAGGLSLGSGCFNPPGSGVDTDPTGTGTGVTDSPTTTGASATDPDSSGDNPTQGVDCVAENAADPACGSAMPYCVGGSCVDCTALECSTVDAATPACDSGTGTCVECTADDATACAAAKAVCVDNACVPCTEGIQCSSGVCLVESGECLLEEVDVAGTVLDFAQVEPTPMEGVTVRVTNLAKLPTSGPTVDDGAYSLTALVPGTLLDIELELPQDDPVFVPATISPRHSYQVVNDNPAPLDLQMVTYNYMAQVAFECGLFATLEEAIGTNAVNPYFISRSAVFGQLVDENGDGVPTVSRGAIQAELGGWANFHDNIDDLASEPSRVCFLEADAQTGTYVGTTDTVSNDTGRFAMFRLRNPDGLGQGALTLRASGFDEAYSTLSSSGNVGVMTLVRNDNPIVRDFAIDIYPVFTTFNCVACHSGGGPPGAIHDGFVADWSLSPRQVWDLMVGPGTVCADPLDPERVCTNDPELSLFVTRPLTDPVGMPDVHPIDIFPTIDDPTMQVIIQWIEQGALPPTDVRFEDDIYPLFQKHACVACHTDGGPMAAMTAGFDADWDLAPFDVWTNLTGPGTTCPDPANPVRICTDDVFNSLLVTNPLLDEVGMPDNHPVDAFNSTDHPDMQLIIQWITQGAPFSVDCEHPECVAGVALNPGCSTCVLEVCGIDPSCCNTAWDAACVAQAQANAACGC